MIAEGTEIIVIPSAALTELRLDGLLGESGVVLEDLNFDERTQKGYMVLFPQTFKNEFVWFIPQESAYHE
ncbi:MAG: hypothetical protein RR559_06270 [Bacteroides sp.]